MSMKENHDATICDSKNVGKEEHSLAFGCEEIYELNGSRGSTGPMAFKVNGGDEHWKTKVLDDFSEDNESGIIDVLRKENLNGHTFHLDGRENADSLPSKTIDEEKFLASPELKFGKADEFILRKTRDSRNSGSVHITISDLFETDADLYTDKNVLECEPPYLSFFSEGANCHIVKDICVDEGMPAKDKGLNKSFNEGHQYALSFPKHHTHNYQCEGAEGGDCNEIVISDELAAASLGITKSIDDSVCENKEAGDGTLLAQFRSENFFGNATAKNCDPVDSMQTSEANCGATGKIVPNASEEESFVESKLPIQEFGTRSFLRSFLNSLDGEGNKSLQPPDRGFSGNNVSESYAPLSVETEPKVDNHPSNILYNSKVETGSITFDFNYPAPGASGVTNWRTNNTKEQSNDSGDVNNHTDGSSENMSDTSSVQFISIKDNFTSDVHEQGLDMKNGNPDNFSNTRLDPSLSSKGTRNEIDCAEALDDNSNDHSTNDEIQAASSKSQICKNDYGLAVKPHAMKHERKNSDEVSRVGPFQYDEGDASFSAAGLITFSGPVAYSGSLSLRSDGSATSGRSFAFPVLQSEWNSSPVRMAKADRRRFRKHKGWRSGLLCCRF